MRFQRKVTRKKSIPTDVLHCRVTSVNPWEYLHRFITKGNSNFYFSV